MGRPRVSARFALALGAIAVLGALVAIFATSHNSTVTASPSAYEVGQPGVGAPAPPIQLSSTAGGTFNLGAAHGENVLLYFQEGLTCQPCWDQLVAIDHDLPAFRALGIAKVVTITTDPLNALRQKVADEGITTPVLSDPSLSVSSAYSANRYGMLGLSRDGLSFVVVGPNGRIRFRADFGGAPNYTMDVPVSQLLADLRAGFAKATS